MFNQIKSENNPKEPKRDRDHDLAIVSCHFLDQFLSLSLFQNFDVFSWFRKLPMDSNWCFFMPWWSRHHPRLILDRFGEIHFSMKIFKILSHISGASSTKTHMYIHNLVNLRVPKPPATQNGQRFCESSNSTERMLRKTENKFEKLTKSVTEDISKIQHPR